MNIATREVPSETPELARVARDLHWSDPIPVDEPQEQTISRGDLEVVQAERALLHSDLAASDAFVQAMQTRLTRANLEHQRDPENALVARNLASLLLFASKPRQALEVLARFSDRWGDDPGLALTVARAYLGVGDRSSAMRQYENLVNTYPHNTDVLIDYASALLRSGEFELSANVFARVLEIDPERSSAANALGILEASGGDTRMAVRSFKKALSSGPKYALAHRNIGLCYYRLGQLRKAVEHYKQAIALVPSYKAAWLGLGRALLDAGLLDEALSLVDAASERFPSDAALLDMSADIQYHSGRKKDALHSLLAAVRVAGENSRRLNNIGVLLRVLGRSDEAERWFRGALNLDDAKPHAAVNLAGLLVSLERHIEARDVITTALKRFGPVDAELYFAQAVIADALGEVEESVRVVNATVAAWPDFEKAYLFGSTVLIEDLEDPSAAVLLLQSAPAKLRKSVAVQNNLAYAFLMGHRIPEAGSVLGEISGYLISDFHVCATKGLYHLKSGDEPRGIHWYQQAIKLAPRSEKGRVRQKLALERARRKVAYGDNAAAKKLLYQSLREGADSKFTRQTKALIRGIE